VIECCVFDLGNVLVRFDPASYVARFVGDAKQGKALSRQLFMGRWWKAGDRGELDRDDVIKAMCEESPDQSPLILKVMERCDEMLEAVDENTRLLRELHAAGIPLFFLSNTSQSALDHMRSHGFFYCFKGGVASFQEGLMKPEPAIYKLLLKRYGLKAGSCLFCDDLAENTAAAQRLGFATITLDRPENLRQRLCAFPEIGAALDRIDG
jgi:HAD superfamily hydrolase (TIGR01509 family)